MRRAGLKLRVTIALATVAVACGGSSAAGQDVEPIGPFAVDARVTLAKLGEHPGVAAAHQLAITDLPGHGFGFDLGAHWYPFRWHGITFGVGGELMKSGGTAVAATGSATAAGPVVETSFQSLAPQVSFNFGARSGWSYVSGGIGHATFNITADGVPIGNGPDARLKTINYGGGARWFAREHVAFAFDIRFYAINPNIDVGAVTGTKRMTLIVLSAGLAFK